jgi:hypothetical protein
VPYVNLAQLRKVEETGEIGREGATPGPDEGSRARRQRGDVTRETGATSGTTRNGTSGVASVWSFDPHALSATRQIQRIQTQIRTRQRTTVDKLKLEPMAEEAKNLKEIKDQRVERGQTVSKVVERC